MYGDRQVRLPAPDQTAVKGVSGGAVSWHHGDVSPQGEWRAADTDREAAAERLRRAVNEGRLDLGEYDERLGHVYAAKTYGELDRVLADLPAALPDAPSGRPRADSPGPSAQQPAPTLRGWLVARWGPWARVVAICVAVWTVTAVAAGELVYFWPFWVAVPWGVVLLCATAGDLAGGRWHQRGELRAAGSASTRHGSARRGGC